MAPCYYCARPRDCTGSPPMCSDCRKANPEREAAAERIEPLTWRQNSNGTVTLMAPTSSRAEMCMCADCDLERAKLGIRPLPPPDHSQPEAKGGQEIDRDPLEAFLEECRAWKEASPVALGAGRLDTWLKDPPAAAPCKFFPDCNCDKCW